MPQRIGDRILLSTTEAAEIAKLSRGHIQRLLNGKQVEGMKLGHDWLVFEDSLRVFLAKPRKPGPKASKQDEVDIDASTPSADVDSPGNAK